MSPKQSMPVLRRFLPAERRFCYGTEGPEGSSARTGDRAEPWDIVTRQAERTRH
jgi:hypothetical protein